ncbi:unnamed protein product [Penicillium pancosmium]
MDLMNASPTYLPTLATLLVPPLYPTLLYPFYACAFCKAMALSERFDFDFDFNFEMICEFPEMGGVGWMGWDGVGEREREREHEHEYER